MTRRSIVLLVLAAASAALLAAPAAATTPARPPQPPSAYVQAAFYDGCSDWYVQSAYPMSVADPQWVFTCWNDYYYDRWYSEHSQDWYYRNAALQKVILFEQEVWDSSGWFWECTLYPDWVGACDA